MIRKTKQILLLTILFISGCIITLNYDPSLAYLSKFGNFLPGDNLYNSVTSIIDNLDDSIKWKSHLKTKVKLDSTLEIPPVYLEAGRTHQLHIFDPRFTFGTILKYIRENEDTENLELPQFHWSDWTDLSYLNQFYFKDPKVKCEDFSVSSPKETEIKNPSQFCFDDADIPGILEKSTDETLKLYIMNFKLLPYSSNFHVFETGGRSTMKNKRMQSKSYLSDFMPPPLNIVLLFPKDGKNVGTNGVKIPVNQDINSRQKIVNSKMYEDTIIKKNVKTVDVQKEIEELDILKLKPTESNLKNFEENLYPWMFNDLSEEIFRQYEAKPHLIKTASDKLYKDSLAYSLNTKVQSKYFSEAKLLKKQKNWAYGGHYDWRFFNKLDNFSDKKKPIISNLLAAWLKFTNTYNIKTWIAHGSLLSWYWNGAVFPWDVDIDVQVPISELHKLAQGFNQSIIVDLGLENGDEIRYGRYFLDCGSWISHRERENGANIIDARFIDIDTGLYIDITALALSNTKIPSKYKSLGFKTYQLTPNKPPLEQFHKLNNEKGQFYNCRNNHFVHLLQVSPLRMSYVEGVPCLIPNDFIGMLAVEYKQKSLIEKSFKPVASTFMMRLQLWVSNLALSKYYKDQESDVPPKIPPPPVNSSPKLQRDHDPFANWEDSHYIKFLEMFPEIMEEYYLMRNITLLHEKERRLYESTRLPKSVVMNKGKQLFNFPRLRHDVWNYERDFEVALFDKELNRLEDMIEKSTLSKS